MAASYLQTSVTPVTGSGTTIQVTFGTCTPGSLLALLFYSGAADADIVTASDSVNGPWSPGVAIPSGLGGTAGGLYFRNNASGGAPVITIASNAGSANWAIKAYEVGGLAGGGALDKTAYDVGTSTTPSAGTSGTLAQASEAAMAYCFTDGANPSAGSGWTIDDAGTAYAHYHNFERQITTLTTAITGDFAPIAVTAWQAVMMTFKDGVGGGGGTNQFPAVAGYRSLIV